MHMGCQRCLVGVMDHAQPHLSCLPPHRTDDGRPVIVIRSMASAFVGTLTRRVAGVTMRDAFLSRILEHLIGFGDVVWQRSLGPHLLSVLLKRVSECHDGVSAHLNFACDFGGGLALTDAT